MLWIRKVTNTFKEIVLHLSLLSEICLRSSNWLHPKLQKTLALKKYSPKILRRSKKTVVEPRKPFKWKCEFCGKAFISPSKLQRHSYSHSGLKPFQCNLCNKSFSQSVNLQTHIKKDHSEAFMMKVEGR